MARVESNDSASQSGRRYQGKPKKKGWYHAVSRALVSVFRVLRKVVELIGELIEHVLNLISSMFELMALFWKSPYSHYVASILIFIGLIIFALHQWFLIGEWFGRIIHARGVSGIVGLSVGTALNLFQLSSDLWKLDFRVAKAYAKTGINPHFEPDDEESPNQRTSNWGSHGHRSLKIRSLISYVVEWGLYLPYWGFGLKMSLLGLVSGFIALVLPQQALKFALQTQEIMREILASIEDDSDVQSNVNL